MNKALSFLCLTILLANCQKNEKIENKIVQESDSLWTYNDRKLYSIKNVDSSNWDIDKLIGDTKSNNENNWDIKPAISNYPSPVAKYDWGFVLSERLELKIGNKLLKGFCIAYAKDKYRSINSSDDFFIVKFNILYLSDLTEQDVFSITSRNYPHYMSTGKQKTKQGEIDWVQMDLADSRNFAIINQRYFDLEFGKTIIVIPHKDGSIRLCQIDESISSFGEDYNEEIDSKKIESYYNSLKSNKELIQSLKNKNIIEQKLNE